MNLKKLQSDSLSVARDYVSLKFKMFMKLKPAKRQQKVGQYYDAVRYMPEHAQIVVEEYKKIYHVELDTDSGPVGFHRDLIGFDLAQLDKWDQEHYWEHGEDFLDALKKFMAPYDTEACEDIAYRTEFSVETKKAMSGSGILTGDKISGEFDAMLGMQQSALMSFTARTNMGELSAKLEESFKLGVWAKGEGAAKMAKAGLSAEMQFMAAVGGELNIDGTLAWKKGDAALKLAGNVNVFGGARGNVGLKLSAETKGKFEASIEAGCFAGLEISCGGTGSFTYGEVEVLTAAADFKLKLGAGAEFSASYSTSIFGPTKVELDMGAALGIGMGTSTTVAVNFAAMNSIGRDAFRTMLYLPTLAQGYKMELMTSDTRNRYFLKKSQAILREEMAAVQQVMDKGGSGYVRLR